MQWVLILCDHTLYTLQQSISVTDPDSVTIVVTLYFVMPMYALPTQRGYPVYFTQWKQIPGIPQWPMTSYTGEFLLFVLWVFAPLTPPQTFQSN